MLNLELSAIKHMEAFARNHEDIISLSQGGLKLEESPKEIKDFVRTVLDTTKVDYYGHGAGLLELRNEIAQTLSNKYSTIIDIDQIIITHGCNGALSILTLLLLEAGDEVILPEPAYPSYTNLTQIARAKPIYVSCYNENNGEISWNLPVEKIKQATNDKTKMIIFSNPSNPTSTVASKKDLLELVAWCEEKGIYLIVDEVYEDYIFDGDYYSITPLIKDTKHLIKVTSFSKNFGLSGWRIGYMVIPKHLYEVSHIMQDSLIIAPSVIGQYAALGALKNPQISDHYRQYVKSNRDLVVEKLQPLVNKGAFKFEKPTAGFYAFLKVNHNNALDLCLDIVKKANVTLVPGNTFGTSSKNYIRLCFARNHETLLEGLKRFTKYWKSRNV